MNVNFQRSAISLLVFGLAGAPICTPATLQETEEKARAAERAPGHWPQWRGPDRDNLSTETGLLGKWPEGGPPLVRDIRGIGKGIAAVAVTGGRVFTLGYIGESEYVTALDERTGERLWAARIGPSVRENSLMRWLGQRTPTVDEDRLYAFRSDGQLVALDACDGKELWRKDYIKEFGGKRPSFGYCDYPLVDGKLLICTPAAPGAAVVALDKASGRVVWKTPRAESRPAYAATLVMDVGGVRQYVSIINRHLLGIRARDGKLLWSHGPFGRRYNSNTPVVLNESLLVTSGYGSQLIGLKLDATEGNITPVEAYSTRLLVNPFQDSALVLGERLYAVTRRGLVRVDVKTGEVLGEPLSDFRGNAAMTYAEGRLYLNTYKGLVALLEPTPEGFAEKGRFTLPDVERARGASNPVVAGGRLYLRRDDRLFCYDVRGTARAKAPAKPGRIVLSDPGAVPAKSDPPPASGAVFVRTPRDVVEKMLELAEVKAKDVVVDLGSGDGAIVITAARKYGCTSVGVEIDEDLVRTSRENARKNGVEDRVRIEHRDMFTADLGTATVVAVYLPQDFLKRLMPQFRKLKPGSRIVSHEFEIPGVKPDRTITVESGEDGEAHRIHLWTTPLTKE